MAYLGTQPNDVKKNTGLYTPSEILQLEKDGHWGGSFNLLDTQTFAGVQAVEFTNLEVEKYQRHIFISNGTIHTNGAETTRIQLSNDGGSTYENPALYDMAQRRHRIETTAFDSLRSEYTYGFDRIFQNAINAEYNGYVEVANMGDSSKFTHFTLRMGGYSSNWHFSLGSGAYRVAEKTDALKFYNLTYQMTGEIKVYGYK